MHKLTRKRKSIYDLSKVIKNSATFKKYNRQRITLYDIASSEAIIKFINHNQNEKKYNNYLMVQKQNMKPGNSGSYVSILTNDSVIKYTANKKYKAINQTQNCIILPSYYNEVFINYIINNINKFSAISASDQKTLIHHTIKLFDYGFYNNNCYIITEKIGVSVDGKYYTTLFDVLNYNIKIIKQKENSGKLLELFDKYLAYIFSDYIKALKILQNHISYVNTDNKLVNIFIKYKQITRNEFKILRNNGIIIDFVLCISDLDKAVYKINNIKYITYKQKDIIYKLLNNSNIGYISNIRYDCTKKWPCIDFMLFDLDIAITLINIYMIYKYNSIDRIYLSELNNIVSQNFTNFNKGSMDKLYSYVSIKLPYTLLNTTKYIGWTFFRFCKQK